jgi:CRISPR-associated endonuclease/helicase Cas3
MALYANSQKQPLHEHLIGVTKKAISLLDDLKINDESTYNDAFVVLFYSSSMHDIGKLDQHFQEYLNKKKKTKSGLTDAEFERKKFIGPYHNEISFCFSAKYKKFFNINIHEAINYCIYWHHPANIDTTKKNSPLHFPSADKIEKTTLQNNNDLFFNETAEDFYQNEVLTFLKNFPISSVLTEEQSFKLLFPKFNEQRVQFSIDIPSYTCDRSEEKNNDPIRWAALKRLCLNILIEADRWISQKNANSLNIYINNKEEQDYKITNNENRFELCSFSNDSRSQKQHLLSEKIANNLISICAMDPGSGKTSIALLAHAIACKENRNRPLIIALPKQLQVTGLFHTIKQDINRIFKTSEQYSIEGFFSGKRQHNTDNVTNETLSSDINILTFDRFLSPSYERDQFNEFIKMLHSNLVLDEFHEFAWLPRMIYSLQEILRIRSWIGSGQKTILLSGTPDPALIKILYIKDAQYFTRNELDPTYESKTKIQYVEDDLYMAQKEDQLISYNTIDQLHESLLNIELEKSDIIHSRFSDKHKIEKIQILLEKYGRTSPINNTCTITAKILQSSFNLNYKNASLKVSHPSTDAQTWGRINRFGNKPLGHIYMVREQNKNIFKKHLLGYKETIQKWHSFLQEHTKTEKEYSIRELLSELYDNFWLIEGHIDIAYKELSERVNDSKEDLKAWFPFRDQYKNKNTSPKKRGKDCKRSFRDQSLLLSAIVKDDKGEAISQLKGDDLISLSNTYEIKEYKDLIPLIIPFKKEINKINEEIFFSFNKYSTQAGYQQERPLFCSHYSADIDSKIESFFNNNSNKRLHRFYHHFLGLISAEVFENLKNNSKLKT